ncbi:MAG: hypothetical protein ACK4WJ_03395 [Endomicrobiia bacterium]
MNYESEVWKNAVVDMKARIFGRVNDKMHIKEKAHLIGENST